MTLTGPPLSGHQVSQLQSQQGALDALQSLTALGPRCGFSMVCASPPTNVAPPGEEMDKEPLSELS